MRPGRYRVCPWLLALLAAACTQEPSTAPPVPRAAVVEQAAMPQPAAAVATRPVTPPYDLAIDERRGGHTLARHVGLTDDQLRERLRREPGITAASTYPDRQTAERVVAKAFEVSADTLRRWRARTGRRPNLVLDRDEPAPIGRSLRRGQQFPSDCNRAVVVLRWDDLAQSSYVLTSYPECRR